MLIRQRHIGDTQSPITSRTSGVGASARTLLYVDGILLSALIGNNNTSASPKWGLITPDAVARVDVLNGPFSAAFPGNSIGSVIAFATRMPEPVRGARRGAGRQPVLRQIRRRQATYAHRPRRRRHRRPARAASPSG